MFTSHSSLYFDLIGFIGSLAHVEMPYRDCGFRGDWRQRQGNERYGGRWRRQGLWTRKHTDGHHRRAHTEQKEAGRGNIEEVLYTVQRSLGVLAEHVKNLERGPDQKTDRPNSGHKASAGPPTTTKSTTDDFASVVKDMYRLVQLNHHKANWNQLPKSLAQRLAKFAVDINPPMVDDEFQTAVQAATKVYADCICETVRQHIGQKRRDTVSVAATRDNTDVDRAKDIADKQISRRLGRRLEEHKRQQLLDQAASVIGSGRRQPQIDSDGYQTVDNKKKPATSPGDVQTPSKKRKVLASTPPVSIGNRFSALAVEACSDDDH